MIRSEVSKRSQILLAADRNGVYRWTDEQISSSYQLSVRTIERFRNRFVTEGLEVALKGKPRLNLDKKKFDGGKLKSFLRIANSKVLIWNLWDFVRQILCMSLSA